ncbi:MAG: tRNA glutamyl-Q(34) synthetase GluQRS [Pseudomonadota bacterium]
MCSARVERFAPSPTGPLHLGHAFSALTAWDAAQAAGGRFLLRIEDIDRGRCRPAWEEAIFADLAWLGVTWETPVMRQSARGPAYRAALDRLDAMDLTYPCTCSRRDIREALSAPQEGAHEDLREGPDGPVYPGTCKGGTSGTRDPAIRLHMDRAVAAAGPLSFEETGEGGARSVTLSPKAMVAGIGDVVLARRDFGTSYHLAVTVDDAAQGITHVTRGADLFEATAIHVLLQRLLDLPVPVYHHHRLIRDAGGRRLAKRDDARAIARYRADGVTPGEVRRMLDLPPAS